MSQNIIRDELIQYFNQLIKINITEDDCDTNVLVSPFAIPPHVLLYIYCDLANKYNIKMNKQMVVDGKFNTINNIASIITNSQERA